jgi:hypothetical protein
MDKTPTNSPGLRRIPAYPWSDLDKNIGGSLRNSDRAIEFLIGLTPSQKIHLKKAPRYASVILGYHGFRQSEYLSDEEVIIHALNTGIKTRTEMWRVERNTAKILKKRGLWGKVEEAYLDVQFEELDPFDAGASQLDWLYGGIFYTATHEMLYKD